MTTNNVNLFAKILNSHSLFIFILSLVQNYNQEFNYYITKVLFNKKYYICIFYFCHQSFM